MERIRMTDVIPLIGIPGPKYGRTSYNIPCPCCDTEAHKKHLNINLEKDVFRCPRCGFAGGVFDLYVQYTGANRKNVREEILERLGSGSRRSRIYIPPAPDLPQPAEECPITDVDTRHETYSPMVASAIFIDDPNANAIGYQTMAEAQMSLKRF